MRLAFSCRRSLRARMIPAGAKAQTKSPTHRLIDSTGPTDTNAAALPPLRWPLLAAVGVAAYSGLLSLQGLGHAAAWQQRLLLMACFLLAALPLMLWQRALWRRGSGRAVTALLLLLASGVAALASNGLLALWNALGSGVPVDWGWATLLRGRGPDGIWMALLVHAALHAASNHAWALQAERLRSARALQLAREAELRALRYQLQPHFLFNTLNAVSALSTARKHGAARELISDLADHLRSTLQADDRLLVPLADELAHTETYLAIEKRRLGQRLQLQQQLAPDLLAQPMPRWLLQPLVENALRRGIAQRPEGGLLRLQLQHEGAELLLQLDNPVADASIGAVHGHGIGYRNVRARLALLFPGRHRFDAGPVPGGYRVQVRWPAAALWQPGCGWPWSTPSRWRGWAWRHACRLCRAARWWASSPMRRPPGPRWQRGCIGRCKPSTC